jgi:hypothetical protein
MPIIRITVTEKLHIQSTSNTSNRCVSPRGSLYLSGRIRQEDDTRVDSFNSTAMHNFVSLVRTDKNGVLREEFRPEVSDQEFEAKRFRSLLHRYRQYQQQASCNISGNLEIVCTEYDESGRLLKTKQALVTINNAADFVGVLEVLQSNVRLPPELSAAPSADTTGDVPQRAFSALRV